MESSLKGINKESMKKKTLAKLKEIRLQREKDFILDGVHEHVRKPNVVPSYNAHKDPHARSYFRQPAVQDMLKRAAQRDGQLIPPAVATYKLSRRLRAPTTPGQQELAQRESNRKHQNLPMLSGIGCCKVRFVIDSVRSDSTKSRLRPVIPRYDALNDLHAQNYFRKKTVRVLLQRTCNLTI